MGRLKTFSVFLLTLGLIGFMGGNSLVMGDENDVPHQTHLTAGNGPSSFFLVEGLGTDEECQRCHYGPPSSANVDTDRCATCHTTGGAYDGVTDSTVGALSNWENRGSSTGAAQSLIYDTAGNLRSGKERWCAGCHDQTETGTAARGTPIDDFESGISNWGAGGDIAGHALEPYWDQLNPVQGINGQYLRLELQWSKTALSYGQISKDLAGNEQDFEHRESFNFYLLMEDAREIMGIKLGLQINGQWSICTCWFNYDGDPGQGIKINGFEDNVWKLVSLPRAAFVGPDWNSGLVDRITVQFFEEAPGGNYSKYFCIDEFGCDITGHNVVGDNQGSGYYVTGHRMSCIQCHDVSSAHIDGNVSQILEYVKSTPNPTNFRFYDDPAKQLRLPYNFENTSLYNNEDFALCYRCHSETNLIGDPWGDGTNFKDTNTGTCGLPKNYHYLHGEMFAEDQWPVSCAHCHDPHGQFNPAMTRKEMGDAIVFDENGCEILPGADSDGDGVDDRHDPDVNMGVAMQSHLLALADILTCDSCHKPSNVTPPNEPPCNPGDDPYENTGCLNDGFYSRSYERLPHTGGGEVDESCGVAGCHDAKEGSHATHTQGTAKGPDPLDCADCHIDGAVEVGAMVSAGACDDCHSPGGAFDGVQMAKDNWDNVYESDGTTLQSGKGQWCATCHDDVPASSRPGPGIEVVVDNPAADFVCEWGTSSTGGYNGDYRWHEAGDGSCTATWTPDLPAAETYNVSAWWKASSNRATNAKYTIYYDGGSDTVEVNQQINGDQWNLLGTYPFAAGTSGYVVLSDDANGYVVADAIKLDNGTGEVSILAPNVIGDNLDYGFYVSGHKINCLSCHDAGKQHIDHEHRTYDVDDVTYAAINPYGDSYRLQVASNKASSTLCFVCHNSTEVLGASSLDVSHTNFWNNDASIANSHWLHVISFTGIHFDSDWDGAIDSTESCITCHNVHGSPTEAMIRHGELISSYGTTDKVPALNFAYLVEPTEFDTATWTPDLAADTHAVYARWKASSNRATNATYTIYYNGGSDTVEVNQQINGDQWNLLGTYPFAAGTSGYVELTDEGADGFVIADAVGWDTDGGAPDVVVDDGDAEFATVGDWTCPSGSGGYGDDYCYAKAAPEPIPDAGVEDSVGGRMSYAGPGVGDNGVCWACHGAISYYRTPYLGPRVIMGQAAPDTVANDGTGTSLITVLVSDTSATGVPDVDTVEIDLTPIGGSANQLMTDDGGGYYSYEVTIPDGTPDSPLTFVITATDDDMNTGEGEAKLTVVDPDSIYVDNPDAEFVCDWGASGTGGYRDDYRWHAAGDGSCTATWTPDLPTADNYSVYAWWKASSNRATDAPYTIYYDGGSVTVDVNQEINGSQWNLLGTFPFAAGHSGYVVLSDDANEYVIADAIKFKP